MEVQSGDSLRQYGIYRAAVLSTSDSTKKGKVKLDVFGLFDGIPHRYLPWAVPGLPLFCGSGSGGLRSGWFGVPSVGSHVWCFFEAGDIQQPVYFSEAPDGVNGFPTPGDASYPHARGFVTPAGHQFLIDDKTDMIKIEHNSGALISITDSAMTLSKSGATITIDNSGNITITGTKVDINL